MEFWKTSTVVVSLDVQEEMKCTGLCSCCDCTNSPDQNTDENDFSDDDGLLFELDGDDTGFDGIFEEQWW